MEEEGLLNKFKEVLKQVLEENGQKAKIKCFNCGKGCHVQKKVQAPEIKIHLTSKV